MANNRELSQFANVVGYNGGNIGIGTDNPQRKLVVSDNGTEGLEFFTGDGANGSTINAYNRATSNFTPFSVNASDYRLNPNGGDEKLRITSTGDVGIGTDDPQHPVHLHNAGSSNVFTTRIQQESGNTPTNGGALLELGGTRSDGTYGFYGGIKGGRRNSAADNKGYLAFFADSNDGQSLSEKARIDHGGRLMVQCTNDSSDSLLIVQGNAGDSGTGGQISIQRGGNANPTAPSDLGSLAFKDSAASRGAVIAAVCDGDWASNDYPTRLEFKVTADGGSSPTERLRIDSSGRMGLGTNSPHSYIGGGDNFVIAGSGNAGMTIATGTSSTGTINFADGTSGDARYRGRFEYSHSTDALDILTAATTRMRISSNGEQQHFGTNATNINIANTASGGNQYEFLYCQHSSTGLANGTNSFRVTTNGNVTNSNNSYGSISDQNLKENIVDATSQWNDIKGLQVRKYNFRENTGHDTYTQIGLIAQEAESVSPGLVQTTPVKEGQTILDADGNQLESIKSINYSVLYMKAVKALQEAQTRIETLESQHADLLARVTALENP